MNTIIQSILKTLKINITILKIIKINQKKKVNINTNNILTI